MPQVERRSRTMEATELTIRIELGNAAFEEPGPEIARILTKLAETLSDFSKERDSHDYPLTLRDANGNYVGTVSTI